jgi:hypothetical protein
MISLKTRNMSITFMVSPARHNGRSIRICFSCGMKKIDTIRQSAKSKAKRQ